MVLITHEMAVIREICDRVVVLEHGRVVEQGPVWQVFGDPRHEVSRTLLAPLQHTLPEELQGRLRAQPESAEAAVVLRLQFTGSASDEPDLAALFSALGGRVGWRRTDSGACLGTVAAVGERLAAGGRGTATARGALGTTGGGAGLCGLIGYGRG